MVRIYTLLSLFVGVLMLPGTCLGQQQGILGQFVDAIGGKQAVLSVKTISRSGRLSGTTGYGPFTGKFEEHYDVAGERGYTKLEMVASGFDYTRETGWEPSGGWTRDTQVGLAEIQDHDQELSGFQSIVAVAQKVLREEATFRVVGEKEIDGTKCSVFEVDDKTELILRSSDGLLIGLRVPGYAEVAFEDYDQVDQLLLPQKTTIKVPAQSLTLISHFEMTKVNQPFPEDVLSRGKPDKAPSSGMKAETTAAQVVGYLDKNDNQLIELDEYILAHADDRAGEVLNNFQRFDANQDGHIDVNEAQPMADYANKQQATADQVDGDMTAKQVVASMDRDSNGAIEKHEAPEDLRLYFSNFDSNGDGKIDVDEAVALLPHINAESRGANAKMPSGTDAEKARTLIAYFDKNKDGVVSKDEANDQIAPYFEQIDTSRDGNLDVAEIVVILPYVNAADYQAADESSETEKPNSKVTAAQIIASMDQNDDGKISEDEANAQLKPYFGTMDTNGDGQIDAQEAAAIAAYANQIQGN